MKVLTSCKFWWWNNIGGGLDKKKKTMLQNASENKSFGASIFLPRPTRMSCHQKHLQEVKTFINVYKKISFFILLLCFRILMFVKEHVSSGSNTPRPHIYSYSPFVIFTSRHIVFCCVSKFYLFKSDMCLYFVDVFVAGIYSQVIIIISCQSLCYERYKNISAINLIVCYLGQYTASCECFSFSKVHYIWPLWPWRLQGCTLELKIWCLRIEGSNPSTLEFEHVTCDGERKRWLAYTGQWVC